MISLINSNDWVITLLSWELFNLTLYILVSMNKDDLDAALSAGLKYFILSALSTGFLLVGVLILYGITGSTQYDTIRLYLEYNNTTESLMLINISTILIFSGLFFKLGAAPLHSWAPDLYNAIPSKISMWMMLMPKLAILTLLFILSKGLILNSLLSENILLIYGIISLIIGSFGLYSQWLIKRFLAYSSISHIGYILLSLYIHDISGYVFYIFIYLITTLNIFLIFITYSILLDHNISTLSEFRGLFITNPSLSFAFISSLFSLAGIPPFLGFFAKYYVISSILSNNEYTLGVFIIIISAICCYKYLNLIKISLFDPAPYTYSIVVSPVISYLIAFLSSLLLFGAPLLLLL